MRLSVIFKNFIIIFTEVGYLLVTPSLAIPQISKVSKDNCFTMQNVSNQKEQLHHLSRIMLHYACSFITSSKDVTVLRKSKITLPKFLFSVVLFLNFCDIYSLFILFGFLLDQIDFSDNLTESAFAFTQCIKMWMIIKEKSILISKIWLTAFIIIY